MKKGIPSSVSAREPRVAPPEVEAAVKAVMRGDSARGLGVLRPLAEAGDVDAQLALGFLYAHGEGVAQNGKRAASWYLKAAMQGEADAQHHLGLMHYLGQGVPGIPKVTACKPKG